LGDRNYPMHWYLQFLGYAVSALRELTFDVLQNIKSTRISINSYKAGKLPCDYVDYVRVGTELGQYISPWGEKESFNRLNNFDDQGKKIPFNDLQDDTTVLSNSWEGVSASSYSNSVGEHLGRHFGSKPANRDSFKILRERGEIQLDVSFDDDTITMDYISDGMKLDASNAVIPYAINTIKKYIIWQMKENARQYNATDRQIAKDEFYNELRILRARMNPMDENDIIRSLRRGYGAEIRN
jgi:hypothetical protein